MDRITASLLSEFSHEFNIDMLTEDKRFEHFSGYITTRRHFGETFDTSDIIVGSGADTGIDSIAIIVNGFLMCDVDSLIDLADRSDYLDVLFVFVQAERSSSFDAAKIGTFGFGVLDFFKPSPALPRNSMITEAAEIMTAIYEHSSKFKRGNPNCRLYYVTTGRWIGDATLDARRRAVVSDLEATQLFGSIEFMPIGADLIQRLYSQTRNAISREFLFSARTEIPEIAGVREAYLGYIPVTQFLSIITDENGDILNSIFYDNVRDWQGDNAVNSEIRQTLESIDNTRFVLMNNGVTIIARNLLKTASRFTIEDFQIVNGCQTSHVLFHYSKSNIIDSSVMIPLRLISTQHEGVIESIIRATNRQTEVKSEQFFAITDFAKQLEIFFQSYPDAKKLYYERRSKQYDRLSLEKTRIVTPSNLIRAFAAMFLSEPHRTTRSYSRLSGRLGTEIFVNGHKMTPYYTAAFALYKLEYMFRNQRIDPKYKPARYHFLLAIRLLGNSDRMPRLNSNEVDRYCQIILDILWNNDTLDNIFSTAVQAIDHTANGNLTSDNIRTQRFTE